MRLTALRAASCVDRRLGGGHALHAPRGAKHAGPPITEPPGLLSARRAAEAQGPAGGVANGQPQTPGSERRPAGPARLGQRRPRQLPRHRLHFVWASALLPARHLRNYQTSVSRGISCGAGRPACPGLCAGLSAHWLRYHELPASLQEALDMVPVESCPLCLSGHSDATSIALVLSGRRALRRARHRCGGAPVAEEEPPRPGPRPLDRPAPLRAVPAGGPSRPMLTTAGGQAGGRRRGGGAAGAGARGGPGGEGMGAVVAGGRRAAGVEVELVRRRQGPQRGRREGGLGASRSVDRCGPGRTGVDRCGPGWTAVDWCGPPWIGGPGSVLRVWSQPGCGPVWIEVDRRGSVGPPSVRPLRDRFYVTGVSRAVDRCGPPWIGWTAVGPPHSRDRFYVGVSRAVDRCGSPSVWAPRCLNSGEVGQCMHGNEGVWPALDGAGVLSHDRSGGRPGLGHGGQGSDMHGPWCRDRQQKLTLLSLARGPGAANF